MLTIVSTCKPLTGEFYTEHYNAIMSWKNLRIKPNIIIVGNDAGVAEFCAQHNIKHIPEVRKLNNKRPLVNDIIKKAYENSNDDYFAYINADIILMDDFSDTFETFIKQYGHVNSFLLTAIRYNVDNFHLLDFKSDWQNDVIKTFKGYYEKPCAIDMFVHKRDNYLDMPDFPVGVYLFDTWMINKGISNFDMSVDITPTCKIYHQFGNIMSDTNTAESRSNENKIRLNDKDFQYTSKLLGFAPMNHVLKCNWYSYQDDNCQIKFKNIFD